MQGDFSRFLFDPTRHYVAVLHQQGRVWLDSDWNEDVLERLASVQQQLIDVVGPCGVPAPGNAFQLSASASAALDDFGITAGRCYVNGIPCQLEANASYLTQPDYPNPPRLSIPTDGTTLLALVYLEVWHRPITYLEDPAIREVALGGPDTSTRLKTIAQVKVKVLPSNLGSVSCSQAAQFLPVPGSGTLTTLQPANAPAQTACQLPDPSNFTGTENRLFRVQIHDGGDVAGGTQGFPFSVALQADAPAGATSLSLATALTADQAAAAGVDKFVVVSDSAGSERARLAGVSADGATLTLAAPIAGSYQKARNATVASAIARFKWSRDNAAFAVQVTAIQSDLKTLTLGSLGRDAATTLRQGDLVEISDDATELGPTRGHLTYLATDPDPDQFTVVLQDPLPPGLAPATGSPPSASSTVANRHVVLRRWDGVGDASATYGDSTTPGMNLGDGVHVQFGGWDLRPGDYWQFATRTADGSVQALTNAAPAGIQRSVCPLAVVQWGPLPQASPPSGPPAVGMIVLQDCRKVFPSLINFPAADGGIQITGLFTVAPGATAQSQLLNDSVVQVTAFGGIDILCDTEIDPASVARPTFSVVTSNPLLDNSVPSAPVILCYQSLELPGTVSTNGKIISWRPSAQSFIIQLPNGLPPGEPGVLTRLRVSGNFIWAQGDPSLYLDGDVFGQPQGTGKNSTIGLSLPSGNRKRGGDFEMWFWLVGAPSFATSASAVPNPVYVGDVATVTVVLSSLTPAGAPQMKTASSAVNVATVANPVDVPAGATSVSFQATAHAVGQTTISIQFDTSNPNPTPVTTTLTVMALPGLASLVLSPNTVIEGGTSRGTVTLAAPAPSSGTVVQLASGATGVATVAVASIVVPAGQTTQTFSVDALSPGSATITASTTAPSPASTVSALLTVRPPVKPISEDKLSRIEKVARIEKLVVVEQVQLQPLVTTPKTREILTTPVKIVGSGLNVPEPLATEGATIADMPKVAAFIRPEERPAVDQAVVDASGKKEAA